LLSLGLAMPCRVRTTARLTLAARQQLAAFFEGLGVRDVELKALVPVPPAPVVLDVR
jgi:hypothetical protein